MDAIPWAGVAVLEKPIVESCMAKILHRASEMEAGARSATGDADRAKFTGAIYAIGHAMVHAMIMARGVVELFAMDQGEPRRGRWRLDSISFNSN